MLVIQNKEHYAKMFQKAEETKSLESFMDRLKYLHCYGGLENPEKFRVTLGYDFAGLSITWDIMNTDLGCYEFFMNGGLIHNADTDEWGVHT